MTSLAERGRIASAGGRLLLAALAIGLLTSGCGMMANPRSELAAAQRDFGRYLRWGEYEAASRYLQARHAGPFLNRFGSRDELHVTAVDGRLEALEEDETAARTLLVVEYYRLPSLALKTAELQLRWRYQGASRTQSGRWVIVGPFPDLP